MVGKRAAIYLRVSSEEQERDGYGLESQLEACRPYCERLGYSVVRRLQDVESGKNPGRPSFQMLVHLASRGAFDVLVVARRDRYFRNAVEAGFYEQQLRKWGVRIESVQQGPQDDTAHNRFTARIIDAVAELEREQIAERCHLGRMMAARAGSWPSAAPFGFRRDKGTGQLVVVEEQAEKLREAYHAVVQGGNRDRVGFILGGDGRAAQKRLHNPAYKGAATYNGVVVPCPRIVEPELWERAVDAMAARYQNPGPYALRRPAYAAREAATWRSSANWKGPASADQISSD